MKKNIPRSEPTVTRPVPPDAAALTPETVSEPQLLVARDEGLAGRTSPGVQRITVDIKSGADAGGGRSWSGRYSRFVSLAKVVFPATAVVLTAAVVLWPQMQKVGEEAFAITFANVGDQVRESQQLVNARYYGSDDQRQAYSVTADLAEETAPGSRVVELSHPQADMTLKDGAWLMLGANSGLFYQEKNVLTLSGNVSLYHDGGYEMHTEGAEILLRDGIAQGSRQVSGQGPFGSLDGEGFIVNQKERTVQVTGKSRLLLRGGEETEAVPVAPVPPAAKAKGSSSGHKGNDKAAGKKQ